MIDRVSDEWLNNEIQWYRQNVTDCRDSRYRGAYSALIELQERRAADKAAPKAEPPLFDKDLVDLVCYCERYIMDNWTDTPDERSRMADATINALTQLQVYRAAEREQAAQSVPEKPTWEEAVKQAAPTEPQPKWERRLKKMKGLLAYRECDERWDCFYVGAEHAITADTAKAAIRKAHKAWEAARDE